MQPLHGHLLWRLVVSPYLKATHLFIILNTMMCFERVLASSALFRAKYCLLCPCVWGIFYFWMNAWTLLWRDVFAVKVIDCLRVDALQCRQHISVYITYSYHHHILCSVTPVRWLVSDGWFTNCLSHLIFWAHVIGRLWGTVRQRGWLTNKIITPKQLTQPF